jgi:hypothetical protein
MAVSVVLTPARVHAATLKVVIKHEVVAPGQMQVVTVTGGGGITSTFHVLDITFPDGQTLRVYSSGTNRWTFVQPPNTIAHGNRTAVVAVDRGSTMEPLRGQYTVGFGRVDLVVPYAPLPAYTPATLWVHAKPRTRVRVAIMENEATPRMVTGRTGSVGWLKIPFPGDAPLYGPESVLVVASVLGSRHTDVGSASFQIQQFDFKEWLGEQHVYHVQAGVWVPTDTVKLGEDIRIGGPSFYQEPAGNMPGCVSGTVEIKQSTQTLFSLPVVCDYNAPGGGPFSYGATRITDPKEIGPLTAVIHLVWSTGSVNYTVLFAVAT